MHPFVNVTLQQTHADCGIAAFAMLAGVSYVDALTAAVTPSRLKPHVGGMQTRQVVAMAKRLGHKLVLRRQFDLENDTGLLSVERLEPVPDTWMQHMVLLKWGLIFDTDGTVWETDVYFAQHKFRPLSLLVVMGNEDV